MFTIKLYSVGSEEDKSFPKEEDSTVSDQLVKGKVERKRKADDDYILWNEPEKEINPSSPGEKGIGVKFTPEENVKVEKSYSLYGFNQYISDQISLHRSLSDPRPKQ